MSPKVSVLIPVYNAEKYLEQCLSSLSAQTFTDFEIICLDDGSRDSSAKVLRAVMRREPRLRLIEQANAGVAAARNRLLAEARGKYAAFIDADDWVEPEYLQALYETAEKENADITKCFFKEFDDKTRTFQAARCSSHFYDEPGDSAKHKLLCGYHDSIVWGKLWRLDFLRAHELTFLPGQVAEDLGFAMLGFCVARRIAIVRRVLYVYRKGVDGAITSSEVRMREGKLHNLLRLAQNLQRRELFSGMLAAELCRLVIWNFASWRKLPAATRNAYLPLFKQAADEVSQWIEICPAGKKFRFGLWRLLAGKHFNRRFYFWSKVFR